MKTTVIYHSADFDGIFCREIARKFIPDAELIGWDYGYPKIPMPEEGDVYILDLSPECLADNPEIKGLIWNRIIWIDHHKSAIEKFPASIPGYRIDGVAACRLAWQWFNWPAPEKYHKPPAVRDTGLSLPERQGYIDRTVTEPVAVRLAGEYDIWDHRDPNALLFQHGLRSRELTRFHWDTLLDLYGPYNAEDLVSDLLNAGKAIQYAKTQENESVIKELGFTFQWEGLNFLACNAARYNSQLFTAGLKPEHDACFGFKWTGQDWSVSLYHAPGKEHHDLSQIAVKYGGGGHRGACGFRTKTLPFLL